MGDYLTTFMCRVSRNLGALTSWTPHTTRLGVENRTEENNFLASQGMNIEEMTSFNGSRT
jgi:hypothetical protein